MFDLEELEKINRKRKAIEALSYLDIQVMWALVESLWRAQLLKSSIFYDIDETLKWETHDRSYRDYEERECWDDHDYEYNETDIFPPLKNKGKVKGQTMVGRPRYARPGTVKGNKRR